MKSGIERFRDEFEKGYTTPAWELFPYERSVYYHEAAGEVGK
ncbi:hypothetical protein [Mobiluncus curtisii]|uniref:Uncharacterized protein n=1 Tax=Mobiluncus curtisii TaxID=2051 RepID=A0A2X3BP56_9ACTO|nr:hypothetical protein [Mobiluncus curtisii]SQC01594.1 Uncharacterised protein [Mobiluncus curtisii]